MLGFCTIQRWRWQIRRRNGDPACSCLCLPRSERSVQKGLVPKLEGIGNARVGLMVCMDREYPEAARSRSRQGAEIVLVPNCCDLATDPDCGDVRIAQARGRAFETVTGIAIANYPIPRCDVIPLPSTRPAESLQWP